MERYIVREILRCDARTCDAFARLGTATVYEAQGQVGLLQDRVKPIQQGVAVCGPAVTVICPAGDNLMIHAAVECCQPGDILEYRQTGEAPAAAPIPASTAAPTPPQVPDLATQLNAELEVIREYRSTLRELAKR